MNIKVICCQKTQKMLTQAYSPELGLADAQFKELLDGLPAGFAFIFSRVICQGFSLYPYLLI